MKYWCKKQLKQNNNLKHKTTKKSLIITAIVLALSGGAFAQTVLPLLPASHGLTGNQPAYTAQQQQEFPMMATGWNWWSSYIDLSDDGLGRLETMLGNNATIINSQVDGFVSYENGIWAGRLSSLSNSNMYVINMNTVPMAALQITGPRKVNAETYNISVNKGWNWIGYPCENEVEINAALANYAASDGDVINSQASGFASYSAAAGIWTGRLTSLVPGRGYKINSNNNSTISFHFTNATSKYEMDNNDNLTIWSTDYQRYQDNMCLMAVVNLQGQELRDTEYEVGAFVGDDCRGATKLMYVESIDRYVAFVSICGEENEQIQFRLLDHMTKDIYAAEAKNIVNYEGDKVIGSLKNPYVLNFNANLNSEELANSNLSIYPNPANKGQMIKLFIPGNHENLKVLVINAMGVVVRTESMIGEEFDMAANLTPGIYTVKIVSRDKQLYIKKLIIK